MFNSEFNLKYMPNFLIKIFIRIFGSIAGVNEIKRETPIIVSLSSKEDNFNNLDITIFSLLNQKVKPDKLILWLSDEYDLAYLPYNITKFIKSGLEINFVKNLDYYTDTIYPLKQFSKAINVIAKDNIYYPSDWLMKLYHSYIAHPKDIHSHIAHKLKTKLDAETIIPFANWEKCIDDEKAKYNNFACGLGGILYPPKCFLSEVYREDIFNKNNITNPDIWFWFMGILSGRKTRVVKNHIKTFFATNFFKMLITNRKREYPFYDKQISLLMNYYRQNILPKIFQQ